MNTSTNEIINAERRGVIILLSIGKIVNIVPEINPAKTPSLRIFFHQSVNNSGGPKAAPNPPHAYDTISKTKSSEFNAI